MRTRSLAIGLGVLCVAAAPARVDAQWNETKTPHYSIFYQAGYEADVTFTRTWLDRAEQLMKSKYGVTPDGYYMSVYLLPAPAGGITGEDIHARLLRNGASTFEAALADETKPHSLPELFARFQKWLTLS